MKVCKVDVGQFDLQNSTYLETGTREDLKSFRWVQVKFQLGALVQAMLVLEDKGKNHNCFLQLSLVN